MYNSPNRQVETGQLTLLQRNSLLRAPTKEDNMDCDMSQEFTVQGNNRMSPGPVKAFSIFALDDIREQNQSSEQDQRENAPQKNQTLMITQIKQRAQPRQFGSEHSPVKAFELEPETNLRSFAGYKQYAQQRICRLNMEHVHSEQQECHSPVGNIDDLKIALNSEKYLKAPVKANISNCNTCTSPDQNVVDWMASKFDLSNKQIPTNSFDSPCSKKASNVIQLDSHYQDSTDFTQK